MNERSHFFDLDSKKLSRIVQSKMLKHSSLASMTGVSERSLYRWLSGQAKRISKQNCLLLAKSLDCRPEEFTSISLLDQLGSKQDQVAAAKAIVEGNLLEILTPSGNFQMAEKILKNLLSEDLPKEIQIKLTCDYAISLWRQALLDEARQYLWKAVEISREENFLQLEAFAQLNLGMIEVFSCRIEQALKLLRFAEKHGDSIHSMQASLYVPNAHFYYGDVHAALETLYIALEKLEKSDSYPEKNRLLATKYGFLCDVLLESNLLADALNALEKSNVHLDICDFSLIRHNNSIRHAEILARSGRENEGLELYRSTIHEAERSYVPSLFYLSGARILRANGALKQALKLTERTIKVTKDPPAKADLFIEKSKILMLMGSATFSHKALQSARKIYRKYSMLPRLQRLESEPSSVDHLLPLRRPTPITSEPIDLSPFNTGKENCI